MMCKKTLKTLVTIPLVALALFSGCSSNKGDEQVISKGNEKVINIGVAQIVEHPSLDSARKGFMDALSANGYKEGSNLKVDFQNAQGDMPTVQTIAQNFASQNKDLVFAIATPTAQAMYNAIKDKPILVTAVTDPVKAGIANSLEKSGTNVTGTTDAAPIEKQLELLRKLVPNAKNMGILYNTSEVNTESEIEKIKKIAPKYGLNIITSGVTNTNEISQSLSALVKNIDVLYAPADNVVASSMPLISSKCIENKIPIIGAVKAEVEGGALATEGIDYYKLGYQTGVMAVEVIKGKSPKEMPITTLRDTELVINMDTANKININVPEDLKKSATIINGGEK